MTEYRMDRVGNLVREKIGGLILGGKIKDPRVDSFLSVTRVEVSRDLTWADVFVSSHKTGPGLAKGVAGLQSAAGFIQAQLARSVRLRTTPRLRFHEDTGIREGFDLVRKLEELVRHDAEDDDDDEGAEGETGAAADP